MPRRPFFYHLSLKMSLTGLTQICGNNSDWSVTINHIWRSSDWSVTITNVQISGISKISQIRKQNRSPVPIVHLNPTQPDESITQVEISGNKVFSIMHSALRTISTCELVTQLDGVTSLQCKRINTIRTQQIPEQLHLFDKKMNKQDSTSDNDLSRFE